MKIIAWIIWISLTISGITAWIQCGKDCASGATEDRMENSAAGVELFITEISSDISASDGSVINYVRMNFKNKTGESIDTFFCNVLLYDEAETYIGTATFSMELGVVGGEADIIIRPNETSYTYTSKSVSYEGKIAKRARVDSVTVNGEEHPYNYEYTVQ